jgi:glucose/arabinose dehydrogenase
MMRRRTAAILFIAGLAAAQLHAQQRSLPVYQIKLPPGFSIEVVARVPNARAMTWGDKGTLFVGSYGAGKLYAVTFGKAWYGDVRTIATELNDPIGVAFRGGSLYVSATSRILRYDDIENHLDSPPTPVVVTTSLPGESEHGGKYIAFGPDQKLYANIGAPCNVCEPDQRHGVIVRMNPDGSAMEVFARGIRNSVGFDWDPQTRELWFTDNGRDEMGDDMPSDELNHAPRANMHFGFPYCHQGDTPDPRFGKERTCSEFTPPVAKMGPHVATLGMRFYTGTQFPAEYRNAIFIAEHGSWDRSKKIGYRIAVVKVQNGRLVRNDIFAEGWLQQETEWGRPVDVLVAPDGSLLVSDDSAGAIYRIRYEGK